MVGRFGLLITLAAALLLACAGVVLAQQSSPVSSLEAGDPIPDHYIVVLQDDEDPAAVASELASQLDLEITHVYENALKGFAARVSEGLDLPAVLSSDPRVEFVAQDLVIEASAQNLPTGVDRIEADQSSTEAGNGSGAVDVHIAIIDTGISRHKDLKIAGGHNCVGRNGGNHSDGNGHGTHVAGTAAAQDNSRGVVGVAPGASLWAVKVLNKNGSGSFSSVICGVDWVTGKADTIKVANMSLGATVPGNDDPSDPCGWIGNSAARALHRAVCNSVDAGVFYAVSAGNENKDFGEPLLSDVPAAFNEVLTVTAMSDLDGKPGSEAAFAICHDNTDDTAANFSNYAATDPDDDDHTIAAPGVCIRSTWKNGNYKTISGTSMASPHVAGTAALYLASNPSATPDQVITALRSDAQAQSDPTADPYYGFVGDPNTSAGVYYGFLVYAGGY